MQTNSYQSEPIFRQANDVDRMDTNIDKQRRRRILSQSGWTGGLYLEMIIFRLQGVAA